MPTHFLGWNRPCLELAADRLLAPYADGDRVELERVAIVLRSRRATRRLLEILVSIAQRRQLRLYPPTILTIGSLVDRLTTPTAAPADRLTRRLAWLKALDESPTRDRVFPHFSQADERDRLALASVVDDLRQDLAAENWRFGDVAEAAGETLPFGEIGRWSALADVHQRYLTLLAELGLSDPQEDRLVAARGGSIATRFERIILVGVVELNHAQREILARVEGGIVEAWAHAPPDLADRFDALGTLDENAWRSAPVDLSATPLVVVDGPAEQAAAALIAIAEQHGRYGCEDIVIGVPDPAVTPYLQQELRRRGVAARDPEGVSARRTAVCRLLASFADDLSRPRPATLASILRHPDFAFFSGQIGNVDALSALDRFYTRHLRLPTANDASDEDASVALAARRAVDAALQPLGAAPRERPLREWAEPIFEVVKTIYGPRTLDKRRSEDRRLLEAINALLAVLDGFRRAPAELAPIVAGADALRLLLEEVADVRIPPEPDGEAIELLGWLELPLDDAPFLALTGFNDGFVPTIRRSDPFLPNALRAKLRLEHNDRLYARDAYLLQAILASRPSVRLIAGRRAADGDPLTPSRLSLAGDAPRIAARVIEFYDSRHRLPTPRLAGGLAPGETSRFAPPGPGSAPAINALRVTAFRDYLACPYRFYLRHVLKLEPLDDARVELDGAAFGALLHETLQAFATSDVRHETNADVIRDFLRSRLRRRVEAIHGREPPPAVRIQAEHAVARLDDFANWQAKWSAEGYRIERAEWTFGPTTAPIAWMVDDQPFQLLGRIDRVDRGPTGEMILFDYKTSDAGEEPKKTHQRSGRWIDLQLPLYRRMAMLAGASETIRLGYVVLPKDLTKVGAVWADWTAEEFEAAEAEARRVIRGVRAGEFGPMTQPAPDGFREFAGVCQDDVLMPHASSEGADE